MPQMTEPIAPWRFPLAIDHGHQQADGKAILQKKNQELAHQQPHPRASGLYGKIRSCIFNKSRHRIDTAVIVF